MESPPQNKTLLDRFIDFIFSDDNRKWLILVVILGALLRFIAASNGMVTDDETVHGPHAIGFLHSGLISTIAECPLWFYLTDIFFKILGVTFFSMRFLSFFYGILSILLVYLIAKKMFDKRIALLSSFLLSISFFTIRLTVAEMDLSVLFFLLFAFYYFIIDIEKNKFPYFSAISIGIASLLKTISLFFVPAFLIAFFLFNRGENRLKFKKLLIWAVSFGLIVLFFFSPVLIHNYLWYKDKQMVDTYFAQYFNVGNIREAYAGQIGYNHGFFSKDLFGQLWGAISHHFPLDPLIISLGIIGILLAFVLYKDKRNYLIFSISFEIFGFILLIIAANIQQTHFTLFIPFLCIFASLFICFLAEKISIKMNLNRKKVLAILLIIIFMFQIYLLAPYLTSACALSKARSYAIHNMDKNSLVVVDARMYRGRTVLMFNDFHYLEASYFSQILELNKNLSYQIPMKVYFVECVSDDCGWGTIKDQPELNQSMEEMVGAFSSLGEPEKIITGGGGDEVDSQTPDMKIYQTSINLSPQMISIVDSTHDWFYYPVNYTPKEKIFDQYEVRGFFDNMVYDLAWIILISSIVLALLIPIFSILIVITQKNENLNNSPFLS